MHATAEELGTKLNDEEFSQVVGAEFMAEAGALEANAFNGVAADILQREDIRDSRQPEQLARPAGAVALGHESGNAHERQTRYDLQTQFSELIDGSMFTSFELKFDGHDLYGEDGRSLSEITQKALEEARQIAEANPSLQFEVRRRDLEAEEISLAIKMAKGELPNTMIIRSDFPSELRKATEDVGGYNVTRMQTMLRALTLKSNGNIQLYSQTLDGSDRRALEAISTHLGRQSKPGELLGQRILEDMSPERQITLTNELKGVYDRSLAAQYGGEWHAGRSPIDYRNTHEFVCRQHDIVEEGVRLNRLGKLTPDIMYKMAATMNKRFKAEKIEGATIQRAVLSHPVALAQLYNEMSHDGGQARRAGVTFSACGETLRAQTESSTVKKLEDAGYGNQSAQPEASAVCVYQHTGCYCCGLNNDGTPRAEKMKVYARRNANGVAHCLRNGCDAWLSADGKKGDIGGIAKKAQRLQAKPQTEFEPAA